MTDYKGKELFAHFDIEADGPSPACNNMLSIGIVFTDNNGSMVTEFLGDFEVLPGKCEDPLTMQEFWERDANNKEELARIRKNARPVMTVMTELNQFISNLKAKRITWVARPAAYDWQWLNYYQYYYLHHGGIGSLSGNPNRQVFKAIDASTMRDIYQVQSNLDNKAIDEQFKKWTDESGFKMTHNALDDARFQAMVYHKLYSALAQNKFQKI